MAEIKAYMIPYAVAYDAETDQIVVRFSRGQRGVQAQVAEVDVTCELTPDDRLWRVVLMDNKHLRLAKVLEQFNLVSLPDKPGWGLITYDIGARVASIYCDSAENAPKPGEESHAQRSGTLVCEGPRLLNVRFPVAPPHRREHDLGGAAAQLPLLENKASRRRASRHKERDAEGDEDDE